MDKHFVSLDGGDSAGAGCLDKARGTLDHMLTTDLSNAEIVLGKLAARLVPTLTLVLCALPVQFLASLLGGIDLSRTTWRRWWRQPMGAAAAPPTLPAPPELPVMS